MQNSDETKLEELLEELGDHAENFYEYVSEKLAVLDKTLKEHQLQRVEMLSPGLSIALKNIEMKLNMTADRLCNYVETIIDKYCDEDQEDFEQDI